jgi:L-serine deaminase
MTSWITLLAALTGGLVGGGIPAVVTYLASQREQKEHRQAQQWQDAEVLADVYRLLMDIAGPAWDECQQRGWRGGCSLGRHRPAS